MAAYAVDHTCVCESGTPAAGAVAGRTSAVIVTGRCVVTIQTVLRTTMIIGDLRPFIGVMAVFALTRVVLDRPVMARAAVWITGMIKVRADPADRPMAAGTLPGIMVGNAVTGLAIGQAAVIHFENFPILSVAMAVKTFTLIMLLRDIQFMAGGTFLDTFMFVRYLFP